MAGRCRIASNQEVRVVAKALRAAAEWRPRNGQKANAIIVLNLLCDNDPKKAKSGIDETSQLNASVRELEAQTGAPVLVQTFKRGPVLKVSTNVRTFIAQHAEAGAIHVVVTAHGGVTWGHYLGKTLVPRVVPGPNSQAPRGGQFGRCQDAQSSVVRPILDQARVRWPQNEVTVSLDICKCADLAGNADTTGYVAAETIIAAKRVIYRDRHAAFAHEMKHVVPAHMLETGPFLELVDVISENARLRDRIAELEAQDADLSITSLLNIDVRVLIDNSRPRPVT